MIYCAGNFNKWLTVLRTDNNIKRTNRSRAKLLNGLYEQRAVKVAAVSFEDGSGLLVINKSAISIFFPAETSVNIKC